MFSFVRSCGIIVGKVDFCCGSRYGRTMVHFVREGRDAFAFAEMFFCNKRIITVE